MQKFTSGGGENWLLSSFPSEQHNWHSHSLFHQADPGEVKIPESKEPEGAERAGGKLRGRKTRGFVVRSSKIRRKSGKFEYILEKKRYYGVSS